MNILAKAIRIAAVAHEDQTDRAGRPYFLHVDKVAHYVSKYGYDENLMSIAYLHDVVEDCGITYGYLLAEGMSPRVIDGIRCLTKVPGESHEEYLEKICSNKDSIIVKLADLRHNSDIRRLKGIRDKDIERIKKYHQMSIYLNEKLLEMK